MAYRSVLRYPSFRSLWVSSGIAAIGNRFYEIALVWLLFEFTDDPTAFAVGLAVVAFPEVVSTMLAGIAADRFNRISILVGNRLVRATLLATIPLFAVESLPVLVGIGVLIGLVGAFEGPARGAVVPNLVPGDELDEANSVLQLLNVCSRILYVVSGALVLNLGAVRVLFISAFPLAVSAIALLWIPDHMADPAVDHDDAQGVFDDFRDVASVLRSDPVLRSLLALQVINIFTVAPLGSIVLPVFTATEFGGNSLTYGVLYGAFFAGMFFSAGFFDSVMERDLAHGQLVVLGTGVSGLFVAGMALAPALLPLPMIGAVVLHALAGMAIFYAVIAVQTLLQLLPSDENRGKLFSVLGTVGVIVTPIGYLVVGPLVAAFGAVPILFALGLFSSVVGFSMGLTALYGAEVDEDGVLSADIEDSQLPTL